MRTEAVPGARLRVAFERGRADGRALLMPFLVAGYPDDEAFVACASAAGRAGADVLEIGIPFSDPIMDGPVIQAATTAVLARGTPTDAMLALAGRAAEAAACPVVVMTYYNLIFRMGLDAFAARAADAGVAGVIVPDLSLEDAAPWRASCEGAGLAPVFIAAQTSTDDRLAAIAGASEGFIYAASLLGVTGVREALHDRAAALVGRIRAVTDTPVALGIGVSSPAHAREVASFADGVIVGSALVARIAEASDAAAVTGAFVAELRAAMTP